MDIKPAQPATPFWHYVVFFSVLAIILVGIFANLKGVGIDWEESYHPATTNFFDYYNHSDFAGFPWLLFFIPHGLLPIELGDAINMTLNILIPLMVIMRLKGGWQAVVLLYTSPFFLDLMRTNNVEWIPLTALLLPLWAGLPFLVAKPQTIGGIAFIWLKRHWRRPSWLVPTIVIILASIAIWGVQKPIEQIQQYDLLNVPWNFAPFPFFIPLGLYLLWKAWRKDDEYIAAAASPFLVPYFAPYSLIPLMTLLACTRRREAFYVWAGFWIYFIVEARRIAFMG